MGLGGKTRALAVELAAQYLALAAASVGETRQDLDEACAAVRVQGHQRKLAMGLLKLVKDRCELEAEEGPDPVALRTEVFRLAAARRRETGAVDRSAVLAQVAADHELPEHDIERLMYTDLKAAHRLLAFAPTTPEGLVQDYELAQAQAVLLRATRVTAEVSCRSPAVLRALFHKLKFHRLLFSAAPVDGEEGVYRLELDGPHSLFQSVTRYGKQFALVLPALRRCDRWCLRAEVMWGRERRPLGFRLEGAREEGPEAQVTGDPTRSLPDELATLLERWRKRTSPWRPRPCAELLHLPGVGLCVPDLVFTHAETGRRVYFELLGYWSREAVWKRVELVQAGLKRPVLFAVSERLRVSEAALGDDLPGALYLFKGALWPAAIEERLDHLTGVSAT